MKVEQETLTRFALALRPLLADKSFRYAKPGEQAITARICQDMAAIFADWDVTAEWNRKQTENKMLEYGWEGNVKKLRSIRPDIIVHHIGKAENLLVVEVKRIENRNDAQDKAKLAAMTSSEGGYVYLLGVRIVIDMHNGFIADFEVFSNGAVNVELTEFLQYILEKEQI